MRAVRMLAPNVSLAGVDLPDVFPGPHEVKIDIRACGICHSDAHYRSGFGNVPLPRTLGHEIAGVVSAVGEAVTTASVGDRVAVHYLRTCGECRPCREAGEQFCTQGEMIGKHCDGGYAESIVVPAANAVPIPDNVPFDAAAVMMCSTATAYHALRLAGMRPGARVAILGFGGLGVSAHLLGVALGADRIAAVDIVPEKLDAAARMGARPVHGASATLASELLQAADGYGFDIALDFTGRPDVSRAALQALAPRGRLVIVALSEAPLDFNPYRDLLAKERAILGCSDHLREELSELLALASSGRLDIPRVISRRVPLDAAAINPILDELERGTGTLRNVIVRPEARG